MNKAILMGRLTRDPEIRYTSNNNTAVCNFTLAVDRDYQQEGKEKEADFIPCIVWDKKGEAAGKYLSKGRRIAAVGRIQTRSWDDNEGKKRYATEVVVENWYFADDKKQESNNQSAPPAEEKQNLPKDDTKSGSESDFKPPWM